MPSVAEKRTFGGLLVRTVQGEVRAAYGLSEIPQLYAVRPRLVGEGAGSWPPIGFEARLSPLSAMPQTSFREGALPATR